MSKTFNLVCPETKKAIWCGQSDRIYNTQYHIEKLASFLHAHEGRAIFFVGEESNLLYDIEYENWIGMREED